MYWKLKIYSSIMLEQVDRKDAWEFKKIDWRNFSLHLLLTLSRENILSTKLDFWAKKFEWNKGRSYCKIKTFYHFSDIIICEPRILLGPPQLLSFCRLRLAERQKRSACFIGYICISCIWCCHFCVDRGDRKVLYLQKQH